MRLILRVVGVVAIAGLALPGTASAQTAVSAEATVWHTPGLPYGNAVRLIVRVTGSASGERGITERVRAYLPAEITLHGDAFARCSLATIQQSGLQACPPGSQLGSGTISGRLQPSGTATRFPSYLVNGAASGELLVVLTIPGSAAQVLLVAQVGPSDEPAFSSMVDLPIPAALASGINHAITEIDVLLSASALAGPYVEVSGCPSGTLPFLARLDFDPAAPGAPATPYLDAAGDAACRAEPPPFVEPMPRPAAPPAPPPPPPPPLPLPPLDTGGEPERAVPAFGVRPRRRAGALRGLRLTRVAQDADVSVLCLRRCGRRGAELVARRKGARVRLARPLRARSRFEVRIGAGGQVARFARYRVGRRARSLHRLGSGCLDAGGQARACPPAS